VLTVGLNRAMHLIADKIANPKKGRRFGPAPGKTLGDHPDKGGPIVVKNGRFGPYVSNNGVNATLPADKSPDTVTLDEAIVLLDARAAALGNAPRGRKPAAKKSEKKTAAPKTAKANAEDAAPTARVVVKPASKRKKPAATAKKPAVAKPAPPRKVSAAE
jgi:DNA topoisomerase-1